MDRKHVFILIACFSVFLFMGGMYYDDMHGSTIFYAVHRNIFQPISTIGRNKFVVEPESIKFVRCSPWSPDESLLPNPAATPKTARAETSWTITDPTKSVVTLLNERQYYDVCDHVMVKIEARDRSRVVKTHGGDFFRTKLYTPEPFSAVGPDYFFDYNNGTYLALFTLRWAGAVSVEVLLVHPSEAVHVLRQGDRRVFNFKGGFTNVIDGKKYSENVTCGIAPTFQPPMCNLSANHTHGPWFCQKPKNDKLTCSNWTFTYMGTTVQAKKLQGQLTSLELETFRRTKVPLPTNMLYLKVRPDNETTNQSLCSYTPVPSNVTSRGFFLKDTWQPFDCNIRSFNNAQIGSCLSGKSIHFYGDSTARQMFTYLTDRIGCPEMPAEYEGSCQNAKGAKIQFKFHGLPIRGKNPIFVKNMSYVAEEIDSLQGGPGEIIILSVWAHFGSSDGLNGTFYRDRLLAIRGAIERLWKRSPGTHVIVRSANTRQHSIGGFILISSDWIALQGEKALRDLFGGDERFAFLDVWDMSLVQKSKDNIHPQAPTLVQMMNYLLTMICSSKAKGNSLS